MCTGLSFLRLEKEATIMASLLNIGPQLVVGYLGLAQY